MMPTESEPIKIIQGDCLDYLKQLPDKSVDLIVTDPPYGINYKSNHGSAEYKGRVQTAQEWDNEFNFAIYHDELMRVLKDDSYCYVWGCQANIRTMEWLGCDRSSSGTNNTVVWVI